MSEYITSDLHMGNEQVIERRKKRRQDFRDHEAMSAKFLSNYNWVVKGGDTCFFLGDVCNRMRNSSKKEDLYNVEKVVKMMNGTKILILGNHDYSEREMISCGFDYVTLNLSLDIAGNYVTMSHCPLWNVPREEPLKSGNWHGEHNLKRFSMEDEGQFHLHGHIHSQGSKKKEQLKTKLGRQFDVGVDAHDYFPFV